MISKFFSTQVPGKWVLTGEHAVLKGEMALALPHPEVGLYLTFTPTLDSTLTINPSNAHKTVTELIKKAQDILYQTSNILLDKPSGILNIKSNIPIGAGFGSSAALCVALARWLYDSLQLESHLFFEFTRLLENHFHGESSGMDIAVASLSTPIRYSKIGGPHTLHIKKLPNFKFFDTQLRASTRSCIHHVERWRKDHPQNLIDKRMGEATIQAEEALYEYQENLSSQALKKLAHAMSTAQDCFETWGLCPDPIRMQIHSLKQSGALAVKLTGAGNGGFLVALF